MPPVLGSEHEIPGRGVNWLRLILDVPVDLALEHDPPLVVWGVVRVGGLARWVADHERLNIVGHDEGVGPGRIAFLGFDLLEARLQLTYVEQWNANGHVMPLPGPSRAARDCRPVG